MLLFPFHHITDTSSHIFPCAVIQLLLWNNLSSFFYYFSDAAAYSSLFVYIHNHFEYIYQINDFHPSHRISLASKPSSVETVKHNQSWMLQFLKWQLALLWMQPIQCPFPETPLGAMSSLRQTITHLCNTGLGLFPCPGWEQIQNSLELMPPLGLHQQWGLGYKATAEQQGQGSCFKQSQKLPARSGQHQLALRWATATAAESQPEPEAASLHESKTLTTGAMLS